MSVLDQERSNQEKLDALKRRKAEQEAAKKAQQEEEERKRLAKEAAEKARQEKKEQERIAKEAAEKERQKKEEQKRMEMQAEAEDFDKRILELYHTKVKKQEWYNDADNLCREIDRSGVEGFLAEKEAYHEIHYMLSDHNLRLIGRDLRLKAMKNAVKPTLQISIVVLLVLMSLAATGLALYANSDCRNFALIRPVFILEIVAILAISGLVIFLYVKDEGPAFLKYAFLALAIVNAAGFTVILFNGRLAISKVIVDDNGFVYAQKEDKFYLYGGGDSESLVISELSQNIEGIQEKAFKGNSSLTSIVIDAPLSYIGEEAFNGCTALSSVEFANGTCILEYKSFSGCTSLSSAKFLNGEYVLCGKAFNGCTALSSLEFADGTYTLGYLSFGNCTSLSSLQFLNGKYELGQGAFDGCTSLTSVEFLSGKYKIGYKLFSGCESLTSVTFLGGEYELATQAFIHCDSLTSVEFLDAKCYLGKEAFYSCDSLTTVTFRNSECELGSQAFEKCERLTDITFEDGHFYWHNVDVFWGCKLLKNIYLLRSDHEFFDPTKTYSKGILNKLGAVTIHYDNATTPFSFSGGSSLTVVLYPGITSLMHLRPTTLVFKEGFNFDTWNDSTSGPYAAYIYLPSSITHVPTEIFGKGGTKLFSTHVIYYQGDEEMWNNVLENSGELDPKSNYLKGITKMNYNCTCDYWGLNQSDTNIDTSTNTSTDINPNTNISTGSDTGSGPEAEQ